MDCKEMFEKLNALNVNEKTEKKNGLTYLSWAWAWAEFKKVCPDATYEVVKFNGLPYAYDENTGYMVYTTVTAGGVTHEMWLPVMDGANKAMKNQPYKYTSYGKEKTCAAATMFDINKTIMRCLTKNLAMFGLGLYIYAGEDLPEVEQEEQPEYSGQPEQPLVICPKCGKSILKETIKGKVRTPEEILEKMGCCLTCWNEAKNEGTNS
jgi:hypothetical protein